MRLRYWGGKRTTIEDKTAIRKTEVCDEGGDTASGEP